MVQAHPLSEICVLGYLRCQSLSKNMLAFGAFLGPDAVDLDKFPLNGYSTPPPSPLYILLDTIIA